MYVMYVCNVMYVCAYVCISMLVCICICLYMYLYVCLCMFVHWDTLKPKSKFNPCNEDVVVELYLSSS